jgi:uncharacterized protein (DUF1697 family)
MSAYVALLRGINLGAHNRIGMKDLRDLVAGLGHTDVSTYVQSGNVVFTSRARDTSKMARAIEKKIDDDLRLTVTVLVRSSAELAQLVERNPFLKRGADASKLHVTFLVEAPAAARVKALADADAGREEFDVRGRDVYLHMPDGYGRGKLTNAFIEKQLGVAGTTRNWKTVTALHDLA